MHELFHQWFPSTYKELILVVVGRKAVHAVGVRRSTYKELIQLPVSFDKAVEGCAVKLVRWSTYKELIPGIPPVQSLLLLVWTCSRVPIRNWYYLRHCSSHTFYTSSRVPIRNWYIQVSKTVWHPEHQFPSTYKELIPSDIVEIHSLFFVPEYL